LRCPRFHSGCSGVKALALAEESGDGGSSDEQLWCTGPGLMLAGAFPCFLVCVDSIACCPKCKLKLQMAQGARKCGDSRDIC